MARSRYLLLIAAAACARGGTSSPPDAAPPDACVQQTYYRDADGDGHGDPATAVTACTQPANTVTTKDDCDDTSAQRHPGLTEICDLVDNDCNAATTDAERCPTGCTPVRRPAPDAAAHSYLVCNTTASWTNASATCASAMYKLVQIDDAAENLYVRTAGDAAFGTGVEFHIGATDSAIEGGWIWEGGVQFWQGAAAGMPIGGRYSNWDPGEPNNSSGAEDCAHMKLDGYWNDMGCSNSLRFICRR